MSKGVVEQYLASHERLPNGHRQSPKEMQRIKTTLFLFKRSWEVVCGVFCTVGLLMTLPGADQIHNRYDLALGYSFSPHRTHGLLGHCAITIDRRGTLPGGLRNGEYSVSWFARHFREKTP